MKIVEKTTENCHFYSREKSLYIVWACFRNVPLRRSSPEPAYKDAAATEAANPIHKLFTDNANQCAACREVRKPDHYPFMVCMFYRFVPVTEDCMQIYIV